MKKSGILLFALLLEACGPIEDQINRQIQEDADELMSEIEASVAADAVKQYEIVKRQGDPTAMCVHAGMVAAAYFQANDEPKYNEWKEVERRDCEAHEKAFMGEF